MVDSNKYAQIMVDNHVAISVDAVQITGFANVLEHPADESNQDFVRFVEKQLPGQFDRYSGNPVMRVVKITPSHAGFIVLAAGEGYVIDFEKSTAFPVKLER